MEKWGGRPMWRGFVLAAAALGLDPGLGPFAVSCHVFSCTINKAKGQKNIHFKKKRSDGKASNKKISRAK